MPEEKKKDSFTFSDKIKNSKPVASKSFANRISSKIGSDGKPKKTLFERTKRDAPFFIAALVALLLLPFLYKYSGQVTEEPLITPGSEESIFDPERYGFDTVVGDPEGQIAQLAGRDPLSLIKGFGSDEEADDEHLYDIDSRSGLDDSSFTDSSVEENNTNIYKTSAAPATRAAFRRAATKINPLSSAGLTSRGGGKLGVGMWGGGLKTAAQKVSAEGPRNSPKPVSLQPLQAAGKPSRSYFGQGAAAEARRSKDAMSKSNAMQALMDAQMKPVEPAKIGGLMGGEFGPGGGNGNLERRFAFNGKEPWWWDMMKRRSQMEWEAEFNRKWDWIKWKDQLLQNILGGILNCVITGTDDGSMGKIFGASAGAGDEDECAGLNKEAWEKTYPDVPFGKDECRAYFKYKIEKDIEDPWKGGNANEVTLGPIAQRLDCLGNGLGVWLSGLWNKWFGKNKGAFAEISDCNSFAQNGIYQANFSSTKDKGWSVLHYVVGVPTNQLNAYYNLPPDEQSNALVVGYVGKGAQFNANITAMADRKNFVPLFIESVAIKDKKIDKKASETASTVYNYKGYWGLNKEGKAGAFKANSYDEAMAKCAKLKWPVKQDCKQEINEQAKDIDRVKKAVALVDGGDLPKYKDFLNTIREGGLIRDAVTTGTKENLALSTKGAKEGKGWVTGARCAYPLVRVSCDYMANISKGEKEQGFPYAHLTFTNGMSGNAAYNSMKNRFLISYTLQGENNAQPAAITTSTDIANDGQWFYVPHQDVRPFKGAWSENITNAGFVTQSLGKERADLPGKGDDYQVVATSQEIQKLKKAGNRVVITWEVRQCNSLLTDGSSITKGGCNNGNISVTDKSGKTISLGQDKPGSVVSTATCVYNDGSDPIGITTDLRKKDPEGEDDDPIDLYKGGNDPVDPHKLYLAQIMSGQKGILYLFLHERKEFFQFPQFVVYGKTGKKELNQAIDDCLDVGYSARVNTRTNPAKVFDQENVQQYVNQVIAKANQSPALQAAETQFEHTGNVTVSELVDAMTLDYAMDPKAQVPLNVVCALGKTIGHNAFDTAPQLMKDSRAWRNMLGAFAAYIGPDSSYYPALYVMDGSNQIIDRRFFGCASAFEGGKTVNTPTVSAQYHYGRYNWSKYSNGDLSQSFEQGGGGGATGRDPYLTGLQEGGWTEDALNPQAYPLYPIAKAVGFQRQHTADEKLLDEKYNGTIDDYNRHLFTQAYHYVLSDMEDSCQLSGSMSVADALRYVGGVCINGKTAKPTNGYGSNACTRLYRSSKEKGTNTVLSK